MTYGAGELSFRIKQARKSYHPPSNHPFGSNDRQMFSLVIRSFQIIPRFTGHSINAHPPLPYYLKYILPDPNLLPIRL
jgi:hypothetical protein